MAFRFWLLIAGLAGAAAIVMGAYGAHALRDAGAAPAVMRVFETGQLYHALHALALLGLAALVAASEGRRRGFAALMLNLAGAAFTGGILLFSGGIYAQTGMGGAGNPGIVPLGGILFMIGWVALALAAFGIRKPE
jgi:uncharacterized membrane protein YgdD (TMEM256/DUF423 family)